jgi:tyrosinase
LGYLTPNSPLPSNADQTRFWKQCQHQTWHFLPWHRGYLSSFEAIMRAAIVKLGGPNDWALPYWNYSDSRDPNARKLPTAFGQARLPDGKANPLLVTRRYGDGTGRIVITPQSLSLSLLKLSQTIDPNYTAFAPGPGGMLRYPYTTSGRSAIPRHHHAPRSADLNSN